MSKNNPFCLSFGKEPDRYVERAEAYSQITETFDSISPSNNCYLIMGVRGLSGMKRFIIAAVYPALPFLMVWTGSAGRRFIIAAVYPALPSPIV